MTTDNVRPVDWRRTAYELQRRVDELEEALTQASECCARPSGVCFNPRAALPAETVRDAYRSSLGVSFVWPEHTDEGDE